MQSMILLGCKGVGGALAMDANQAFGLYSLGFCVGGALVVLGLHLWQRRWLLLLLALGLVAAHPYWRLGVDHGDCGYALRIFARAAAAAMLVLLLWTLIGLGWRQRKSPRG